MVDEEHSLEQVKTTRIPKHRVFDLGDGNPKDEIANNSRKQFEKLMKRLETDEVEVRSTSGNWHEGRYRVQVFWSEIKKEKVKREDTDYESTEEMFPDEEETTQKNSEEIEKEQEEETKTKVAEQNDAFDFNSLAAEEENGEEGTETD